MAHLTLEIVEGPGAGRQVSLDRPLTLGRDGDVDVVLEDTHASRRHAVVSPAPDEAAVVEDLQSANGTFVNHNEVSSWTVMSPGDELLVGVTVFLLRRAEQVAERPSAVHAVPVALASPPPPAAHAVPEALASPPPPAAPVGTEALDPFLDVNTRQRARLAPLAVLALVAVVVLIYLGAG